MWWVEQPGITRWWQRVICKPAKGGNAPNQLLLFIAMLSFRISEHHPSSIYVSIFKLSNFLNVELLLGVGLLIPILQDIWKMAGTMLVFSLSQLTTLSFEKVKVEERSKVRQHQTSVNIILPEIKFEKGRWKVLRLVLKDIWKHVNNLTSEKGVRGAHKWVSEWVILYSSDICEYT